MEDKEINKFESESDTKMEDEGVSSIDLLIIIDNIKNLSEQLNDKFYKKHGLTTTQFNALSFLYFIKEKSLTLSEISEKLNIKRSSATTLVDRMESNDLVKRVASESDKRSVKVEITDKGRLLVAKALPENEEFKTSLLNFLSEEDKKTFYNIMLRFEEHLTEKLLKF